MSVEIDNQQAEIIHVPATRQRKFVEIIATIEQPRSLKPSGWQAAGIRPVKAEGITLTSIVGVTAIRLSRFMRVRVKGFLETRFGKYQLAFTECEEVAAEYAIQS
jgi:hypothetical protein